MPTEYWTPAFVGLGSNLDDPPVQIASAVRALDRLPSTRYVRCSSLFRSAPVGPVAQPDFCNAVAALLTRLQPPALMGELIAIERALGRRRNGVRWGPRRIDLDLLLHGDTVHADRELTVPHPRLAERAFVVCPLTELAPWLRLPDGRRVGALTSAVDCSQVKRIGELTLS